MQRILVNALSVTNHSGAHVLLGHLAGLVGPLADCCRFTVLCRPGMQEFRRRLGDRVDWRHAPAGTRQWLYRAVWEFRGLARAVRQVDAQAYFTPSGIAAPGLAVPQIVFCQNPWALTSAALRRGDLPKAWLQRRAYRHAMRVAEVMVFNSGYMRAAYRRNAGFNEKRGLIVYQAPDDATRDRAATAGGIERRPGQIVCVSVMGPHKNVETVIRALGRLRSNGHAEAHLIVAGSWPDAAYEKRIRNLTLSLGINDHVRFAGFLERADLDRLYAEARVFCLMSRCESFGIPAVEAQLFGTPVVSSNVCAIPEVCGSGGIYLQPDDVAGVTEALARLLAQPEVWRRYSLQARENANRFAWESVTRPLRELFAGDKKDTQLSNTMLL